MGNGSTPEAQPFANPLSPPADSRLKEMMINESTEAHRHRERSEAIH